MNTLALGRVEVRSWKDISYACNMIWPDDAHSASFIPRNKRYSSNKTHATYDKKLQVDGCFPTGRTSTITVR